MMHVVFKIVLHLLIFGGLLDGKEHKKFAIHFLTCRINKAESAGKQAVKQYPLQFASTSVNPIPTRKEFMSTIFRIRSNHFVKTIVNFLHTLAFL